MNKCKLQSVVIKFIDLILLDLIIKLVLNMEKSERSSSDSMNSIAIKRYNSKYVYWYAVVLSLASFAYGIL